jgi:lipoprotein-anchoring transpeptidase ErfK/SrfK
MIGNMGRGANRVRALRRATVVALVAAAGAPASAGAAPALTIAIRPHHAVTAHASPGGRALLHIHARTAYGSPTRLSVIARRGRWLATTAVTRGENRRVWIKRSAAIGLRTARYRIVVSLSARRLELWRGTRMLLRTTAGVGRAANPTPVGRFSLTDKLAGSRFGAAYGCCLLALYGIQPHPPAGWSAGAQLALHGTDSPSSLGRAASSGCVRLGDRPLRTLMRHVPLGTPVTIER